MKIILKNLRQVQYDVELESDKNTIKDLKNEVEKIHGFNSNQIKLLYNGKVLDDNKTLEDYQIKEENIIIMMNTKPKQKTNNQSIGEIKVPSRKREEPPKNEEEKPNIYDSVQVNQLLEMGYDKEQVKKALNAAHGDIQLAIEFLSTGVVPEPSSNNHPNQHQFQYNDSEIISQLKKIASNIKIICY